VLQLFEVELLRWESVNDLSDEKDGSLMKKIIQEGDLNVWDKPKDVDLVTIKLSAKVADSEEFFEKDLEKEFKMQDGFFCPAVKRVVQGMKQGEAVQVKVLLNLAHMLVN
jgi:FK506-binding protein 4/5